MHSTECLSQVQGVLPALGEPSSRAKDEWTDGLSGLVHRNTTNSHPWALPSEYWVLATRRQVLKHLESAWRSLPCLPLSEVAVLQVALEELADPEKKTEWVGWKKEKQPSFPRAQKHGSEVTLCLADNIQTQCSGPISPKTPNEALIGYPCFIVESTEALSREAACYLLCNRTHTVLARKLCSPSTPG